LPPRASSSLFPHQPLELSGTGGIEVGHINDAAGAETMRSLFLWMIGIPIPVIILIWLFT
jgi:hypothetical protein